MTKAITQEQLDKAVAESRGVLEQLLFQEINNLTKAALGDGDGDEDDAGDGAPPAAEGSAETPSSSDASPGEAPGEDAPQDPAAGGMGAGDGAPPTMDQLVNEYAQLDPEELKMHMMAAQAAYEQVSGGAGAGPDAGAGGPPPGPGPGAAPPGAAPPGPDMGMGKSEVEKRIEALGAELKKAQAEIQTLKKSNGPRVTQRAVTGQNATERLGADANPKPRKTLNKSELTKTLTDLTKDPAKLTKAEREKINDFYNGGQKDYALLKNIEGLKSLFA